MTDWRSSQEYKDAGSLGEKICSERWQWISRHESYN